MYLVAIYRLQGTPDDLAGTLAAALGILPYEARSRVAAPGGGPAVVGCFADSQAAEATSARLRERGFSVLVLDSSRAETEANRFVVHQPTFGPQGLQLVDRRGERCALAWEEIRLLVRGAGILTATVVETAEEKKFSPGRAILSGGLVLGKSVRTTRETTLQERSPFLHAYAPGHPPVVLRQEQMDYATLGPHRQLVREANFNWICAELRRHCPEATWDDRLQTRAGQAQLLGPTLSPDQHLDLAITLLARALGHFLVDERDRNC